MRSLFKCIIAGSSLICLSCGEAVKDTSGTNESAQIEKAVKKISKDMKIACYGLEIETGKTLSVLGDTAMPMQSTYKFPLALAVLDRCVSKGIALDSLIPVASADLVEDTWSPMRDSLGKKGFTLPLKALLYFVTACSDNIACDVLFRFYGGPARVDSFISKKGFPEIEIRNTETELHEDWRRQYLNCTPPRAMSELLASFYQRKLLNEQHTTFLLDLMTHNKTGDERIRAGLPKGTLVADKTGTCYPEKGPGTVNDIAIITLPNGHHLALSIYITDALVEVDKGQAAIAATAKLFYEHFTQ